jgi:hypothetical protein
MFLTFIGNPNDPSDQTAQCEFGGVVFVKGLPTDVSGLPEAMQKRLAANSHFSAAEAAQPKAAKRGKAPRVAEEADEE